MKKNLVALVEEMIGNDCKVEIGDTFKYCDGVITVNPKEGYMANLSWKKFLQKEYGFVLTHKNWFVLSVLHELGHHYTIEYFTVEEWNKSQHECEHENEHYYEPVEKIATDWAVEYYKMANMQEWEDEIMRAIA